MTYESHFKNNLAITLKSYSINEYTLHLVISHNTFRLYIYYVILIEERFYSFTSDIGYFLNVNTRVVIMGQSFLFVNNVTPSLLSNVDARKFRVRFSAQNYELHYGHRIFSSIILIQITLAFIYSIKYAPVKYIRDTR